MSGYKLSLTTLTISIAAFATYSAFAFGVGTASVIESVNNRFFKSDKVVLSSGYNFPEDYDEFSDQYTSIDQTNKTITIPPQKDGTPILRLEVIRDGKLLCFKEESTPPIDFILNSPIEGCPTLVKGDVLKATWVIYNEIKVTHG